MKINLKKHIVIIFILIAFSAKAQNNIHTKLHEADVYYSLKENAENLSIKIYQLVLENKLDVFKDSSMIKPILYEERKLNIMLYESFSIIRPGSEDPYNYIDTFIMYSLPKEHLTKIIFSKKYIDFYIDDTKHFYLQTDKVFKLLTKEEKEFYEITVRYLDGKITNKSIMDFSKKGLKNLTENIYNLGKKGNIIAYKNEEFSEKYSVDEVSHLEK